MKGGTNQKWCVLRSRSLYSELANVLLPTSVECMGLQGCIMRHILVSCDVRARDSLGYLFRMVPLFTFSPSSSLPTPWQSNGGFLLLLALFAQCTLSTPAGLATEKPKLEPLQGRSLRNAAADQQAMCSWTGQIILKSTKPVDGVRQRITIDWHQTMLLVAEAHRTHLLVLVDGTRMDTAIG